MSGQKSFITNFGTMDGFVDFMAARLSLPPERRYLVPFAIIPLEKAKKAFRDAKGESDDDA